MVVFVISLGPEEIDIVTCLQDFGDEASWKMSSSKTEKEIQDNIRKIDT